VYGFAAPMQDGDGAWPLAGDAGGFSIFPVREAGADQGEPQFDHGEVVVEVVALGKLTNVADESVHPARRQPGAAQAGQEVVERPH